MSEKLKQLEMLYRELENCNIDCPLNSTYPPVKGHCDGETNIAFVGEAPGAKEAETGTPFVGIAGDNFSDFLSYLGLSRENIFITNTVKCRPTVNYLGNKNRAPYAKEIKACSYYLYRELNIMNPKLIITLGNIPLKLLLGDNKATISNHHGILFFYKESKVFPIHHPGAITYNPKLKNTINEDLQTLKKLAALQK